MYLVVDPGLATTNLGDQIISDAVDRQLIRPLRAAGIEVDTVPMHGTLNDETRERLVAADQVIVSGTNLLSDHMRFRRSWQWDRADIELTSGKLTTFGVGWWQYQRSGIDLLSARWLRSLAGPFPWAVRDVYSAERLNDAGIASAHTSCPTLWDCTTQVLPGAESRVVVTLTDYNQDRLADQALVKLLEARFEHIEFWPQGPGDRKYIESLDTARPPLFIDPTLEAFDSALKVPDTAYIGLRLHGGIRAIQMGIPSLIFSIDNRAREISKSVGLVAPSRNALVEIRNLIGTGERVPLRMPHTAISDWIEKVTR